jgi:cytidylate kinase
MAIITVSRGSMSGGEALAACLHEKLGYPMIGREALIVAAKKLGVTEEELAQKMTRGPGFWERMTSGRRFYLVALQEAITEYAIEGNLIYHGHAGHLLLAGVSSVLRIRLIAPLAIRVRAVMERQHLNREAAVDYINHIDEDRIRWTKFIYGKDWSDPALYDLVINLEKMSLATACLMIAAIVDQPEFVTTDEVKKKLANFHLACQVKVALATNVQTKDMEFEVSADGGSVEISGEMPRTGVLAHTAERDEAEIMRTAQSVEGVKTVFLNLKQFSAFH